MKYIYRLKYLIIVIIFGIFNFILLGIFREPATERAQIKPEIVLICHVKSNPYWQYIKNGAEKAAKERNAVVKVEGPDYANVDEGLKLINMAYAAKVSGIITYVQEENKYNSVINKVVDSGIPILTIDSDAQESKRLAYIGTDNIGAGTEGAKEMIRQIGTEGNIGIVIGGKEVTNQKERVEGFKKYINDNSKLNIVSIESSDSYLLEAELAAKKILTSNYNIKALFCTSALDGVGAAKAVSSLGLVGKVKIVAFDDLPETLQLIESGVISSSIVQKPYLMGYNSVNMTMDILEGKKVNKINLTDVQVVDKNNIDSYKKKQGE
ncbi:substrate-binding domain-containing protein [Clostridium manihotivorum]|uniref:Sugar ABC transporter substrate-binding protein n=1 Tax=Clostridium manihotivorum TaxID=2320868 RepID=A0A3R5QWZ5_9CLOT|nr:substrate-binding domain-containing protein [Clostridium manihotivorum]QAA34245.1 sugar ABC transporter substrate-binding protein [Clostridium manihotivorum]